MSHPINPMTTPSPVKSKLFNTARIVQRFFPSVIWRGDPSLPQIALTFDDGPDPVYTPAVLDVLARFGVRASFFLKGKNIELCPEVVGRMAYEGHIIGNHTFNHPRLILRSGQFTAREIKLTEEAIRKVTGGVARLFRPPYGHLDWTGFNVVKKMGYRLVMWSAMPRDWESETASDIISKVLPHLANGVILLLHDKIKGLPMALGEIIKAGRQKGFSFVSLDQMRCL